MSNKPAPFISNHSSPQVENHDESSSSDHLPISPCHALKVAASITQIIMSRKMNIEDAWGKEEEEMVHYSSFSSTLLEAVYRSIDKEEDIMLAAETSIRKTRQSSARDYSSKMEEIEKWMEKRTVSTGHPRTKPLEAIKVRDSSSVDRDSPAALSKIPKSKSTNSGYQMPNPDRATQHQSGGGGGASTSSHFVKTKSHALKFYKELKKMKQPISPGGRLATMINSLFLTGHSKKAKFTDENDHEEPHHHHPNGINNKSTCSSSRSCLSHKTSSSSASSTNKPTRSVRFNEQKPVKNMDECCDIQTDDIHALLRKYQNEQHLFAIYNEFEEEVEDGASSCGSSDLFELDHLMGPELPVYETTRLDANRPIANSLLA